MLIGPGGGQSSDSGEGEGISLVYSRSVEASPKNLSRSRQELESDLIDDAMDIDEPSPEVNEREEVGDDEADENVINFDDISSDFSDEEEGLKGNDNNEANGEGDEDGEGIDPGVMNNFFSDVYRLAKTSNDEGFQDENVDDDQDRYLDDYEEESMGRAGDEGDLDYGDNLYFEDDDEGGDY